MVSHDDIKFQFSKTFKPSLAESGSNEYTRLIDNDETEALFNNLMKDVCAAIKQGILPELILAGSSGSYFVRSTQKQIVGVFKPKNEEPYGENNPKMKKYLQRLFCPCMFGRSCLVANSGYLSEAAASLVDRRFGFGLVPSTMIVRLAARSFYYKYVFGKLPRKVGSMQLFVAGYTDAGKVLARIANGDLVLPKASMDDFLYQFQKLVCLDYIIRNTDRNNDNWLIKVDSHGLEVPITLASDSTSTIHTTTTTSSSSSSTATSTTTNTLSSSTMSTSSMDTDACRDDDEGPTTLPKLTIAAIDNGLAFPRNHPDHVRGYPYHWMWLPYAKLPMSDRVCDEFLSKLRDAAFVRELVEDLYMMFRNEGHKPFMPGIFDSQMAVMRGQIANLIIALQQRRTPEDLVHMPLQTVKLDRLTKKLIKKAWNRKALFSSW